MNNKKIIEAILFSKGNLGANINEISSLLNVNIKESEEILKKYSNDLLNDEKRAFFVKKYGDYYKLLTKKEMHQYLFQVADIKKSLTPAVLETLTIIAYKQPISKVEIENIRGSGADYAVSKLISSQLVEPAGRANTPGSPFLYKTTQLFLDNFNLETLRQLPELIEFFDEQSKESEIQLLTLEEIEK